MRHLYIKELIIITKNIKMHRKWDDNHGMKCTQQIPLNLTPQAKNKTISQILFRKEKKISELDEETICDDFP